MLHTDLHHSKIALEFIESIQFCSLIKIDQPDWTDTADQRGISNHLGTEL